MTDLTTLKITGYDIIGMDGINCGRDLPPETKDAIANFLDRAVGPGIEGDVSDTALALDQTHECHITRQEWEALRHALGTRFNGKTPEDWKEMHAEWHGHCTHCIEPATRVYLQAGMVFDPEITQ